MENPEPEQETPLTRRQMLGIFGLLFTGAGAVVGVKGHLQADAYDDKPRDTVTEATSISGTYTVDYGTMHDVGVQSTWLGAGVAVLGLGVAAGSRLIPCNEDELPIPPESAPDAE